MFAARPSNFSSRLLLSLALLMPMTVSHAFAQDADTSTEAIQNDPATPVAGNPKGDLTIVTFFDYNCPFCK